MTIKELRLSKGLTQQQAAQLADMPLRTYCRYENVNYKGNYIKYNHIMSALEQYGFTDEEHGILEISSIKEIVSSIISDYNIDYCYLFGSYAKGKATEKSDVDLLISSNVTGIKLFGLIEKLRNGLKKKVDLLTVDHISGNMEMMNEILKDGIKIYG